jgi:hypothetical protein
VLRHVQNLRLLHRADSRVKRLAMLARSQRTLTASYGDYFEERLAHPGIVISFASRARRRTQKIFIKLLQVRRQIETTGP